jgi:hypothetical protein
MSQRWVVVMVADPDANGPPGPNDPVHIANFSDEVIETTIAGLPALLQEENAARGADGLPPLPDLTTIRHNRPAVAPPPPATR